MIQIISNERPNLPIIKKTEYRGGNYGPFLNILKENDSVSFGKAKIKPAAELAATCPGIKTLVETARKAIGDNSNKKVRKLLEAGIKDFYEGNNGEAFKKLQEKDKNIYNVIKSVLSEAERLAKADNKIAKSGINKEKLMDITNSAIEDYAFVENKNSWVKGGFLHWLLNLANTNQGMFSATFGIVLTCLLRPFAIMALPSKNKDDNAYASAHSISSGLIGFLFNYLTLNPIAKAIKTVRNNVDTYIKDNKVLNYLGDIVEDQVKDKNGKVITKKFITGKNFDTGAKYINLCAEMLFAIPKAAITVSCIPPIMNFLGLKKGKKNDQNLNKTQVQAQQKPLNMQKASMAKAEDRIENEPVTQVKNTLCFAGKGINKNKNISFGKKAPDGDDMNFIIKFLSKQVSKIMQSDLMKKILNKTNEWDIDVVRHLSALNGLIIGGVYVNRTLNNEKIDPERRATLAINQGSVSVISTILGYLVNGVVDKKIDKAIEIFQAANYAKGADKLGEFSGGIRALVPMFVFGFIYRFFTPVGLTPIANKLGEWWTNFKAKRNQERQLATA